MPHLFTNRPRQHNLLSNEFSPKKHFNWESANAVLYLIGGLTFIAGSVFFLPKYEAFADWGSWIFFWGSLLYLIVTVHDLLESARYLRLRQKWELWNWLEFLAANVYVGGTILFIVGSIFFLSKFGFIITGGWCFIIGSLLFLLGACINVMQIIQAGSLVTLQLLNATAIAFILGSALFLVASVPYLWKIFNPQDRTELFTYLAWLYIVGSILFFLGGAFNYYRAYRAMRHYTDKL